MKWIIPGTILSGDTDDAPQVSAQFHALFLAGDMVLGQVSHLSGLPDYMIQNWVKRGFLSPPKSKRYSMNQLCRILNINMLKGALSMDEIVGLLHYINGRLDDESDDLIDDSALYILFVNLAARSGYSLDCSQWDADIDSLLDSCPEYPAESKRRIAKVLRIMLSAWIATRFRNAAAQEIAAVQSESATDIKE